MNYYDYDETFDAFDASERRVEHVESRFTDAASLARDMFADEIVRVLGYGEKDEELEVFVEGWYS